MYEINLFCFGFGQVAKKFIQKLLQNKIKVNLITTTRQKTSEVSYFDLKFKNFNVTEHNFDNDLPKEIKKFNHILVSTPPINQKDLFFELLNLNNQIMAWEANCPNQYPSSCSTLEINGVQAVCNCDEYKYSLATGQVLSNTNSESYPMKLYYSEKNGNSVRISN